MEPTQHIGKLRKGWELTKSSWRVLILDKELLSIPLIGMLVTITALIILGTVYGVGSLAMHGGNLFSGQDSNLGYLTIPFMILVAFTTTLIGNFFTGAVIVGATQRFHGQDPTVRSAFAATRSKLRSLALFSLLMATVGLILQAISERVPFGGRIAVWLVGAAWNLANFFALPIIVLSEEDSTTIRC